MTKTRSDVPVFLLYAGILHAIALALLLPMIVTLPGPGGETGPARAPASARTTDIAPVDVLVLPPPQLLTDVGPEETSALPAAPRPSEGTAPAAAPAAAEPEPRQETKDDGAAPAPAETGTVEQETPAKGGVEAAPLPNDAVVPPAVAPQADEVPQKTEPENGGAAAQEAVPTNAATKANTAAPVKASPRTEKTSSARRGRTAKPAPSRTATRTAKSQSQFAPFNGTLSGLLSPPANKRR